MWRLYNGRWIVKWRNRDGDKMDAEFATEKEASDFILRMTGAPVPEER
jgi:hypothetical protein